MSGLSVRTLSHMNWEWMKGAICRDHEDVAADWYADTNTVQFRRAVAVCHTCPVESDCLEYALASDEPFGVWGGMGPRERTREMRRRRAPSESPLSLSR